MVVSAERRKLYEDIQMLCAGHDIETALSAVIDSAAGLIAFGAKDRADASELVQAFVRDIERTMDDNWGYVRELRATTIGHPNTPQ